jgi:microcystin-dependent protein
MARSRSLADLGNGQATFKIGDVMWSSLAAAPTAWLACNGGAISRTTYAALFAAIGTTYGAGDGTTTFNLPDTRGRALVGVGTGTGLTARALGATGGAETHQLSIGEMPAHTHLVGAGGSGGGGRTDGGVSPTRDSGSAGSNQAHNNMQPFLALNAFIYAGV